MAPAAPTQSLCRAALIAALYLVSIELEMFPCRIVHCLWLHDPKNERKKCDSGVSSVCVQIKNIFAKSE